MKRMVEKRVGQLAAELVLREARAQRFGVILRDIEPIDSEAFINTALEGLRDEPAISLRIAVPDPDLSGFIAAAKAYLPEGEAKILADTEEEVVKWRNEHQRTIAVLTNRPLTRGASLRDFIIRDNQDAIKVLADQQSGAATTAFLRNFWKALVHNQAPDELRLRDVVRLSLALEGLETDDKRGLRLKGLLPEIGLFRDHHIFDKNTPADIAKRLSDNHRLVETVRSADRSDFARMRAYVTTLKGAEKSNAKTVIQSLKKLSAEGPSRVLLEELEFGNCQKVWLARKTSTRDPEPAKQGQRPVQVLSVQALIDGDVNTLQDLDEAVAQGVERVEDGDAETKIIDLSMDAYNCRATLALDADLLRVVRAGTSEKAWGIIVHVDDLTESAILEVEEWGDRQPLDFDDPVRGAGGLIKTFVENQALSPVCASLAEELKSLRSRLIEHLPRLAFSPLTTLAARAEVLSAAQAYLETYRKLLESVCSNAQEARGASGLAEMMFASLTVLDTYIFKSGDELAAVLSPIHPLHLWRWVVAVKELTRDAKALSVAELEAVEDTLSNQLHYLTSLHMPEDITRVLGIDLGLAGQIGPLPLFRKNPRTLGTEDGIKGISKLATSLAKLRPFVRPGFRVLLVNPPAPHSFVRELIRQTQLDLYPEIDAVSGMHVRVRYTSDDALSWVNELDDLDEETRELIELGRGLGRVSLDAAGRVITPNALEEELGRTPAHLTVVFDPFEVRKGMFRREGAFSLNPWVLSYRYEYDRIQKKVNQIPVADSNVFGSYLQMVGTLEPRLRNQTIAHAPNAEEGTGHLSRLLKNTTWLVVADRHGVPIGRNSFPDAFCVDVRQDKRRTLTTLASDLEPFEQALARELKKTFFNASKETLASVVSDLVNLEPGGILGAGTASKEGDRSTKAALGKIVVVRSYRRAHPKGLAVSLDTPEARQWLVAGKESRRQADLIGLRETEEGGLVLDVIEVKTHDSGDVIKIDDGIVSGDPVDQIMATYRAVASIFGGEESESPMIRPRREVLRNHLYQACLRDTDPEFKERWHSLLNDLFDRRVDLKIEAQIVRVRLGSTAPSAEAVYRTKEGVPVVYSTLNAEEVGLTLETTDSGRGGAVRPAGDLPVGFSRAARELEPSQALALVNSHAHPDSEEQVTNTEGPVADGADAGNDVTGSREEPLNNSHELLDASSAATLPAGSKPVGPFRVLLGTSRRDGKPLHWEVSRQDNGFFLILGASGSGKTETLKVVSHEIHEYGIPCLIFDFHGDVTLDGAEYYVLSHGPACTHGVNPMELDSLDPADGGVYAQVNILLNMLKACVPSLGHRQWRVIKDAINQAYTDAGISDEDPESWKRTPPDFGSVLGILNSQLESDDLSSKQKNIVESAFDAVARIFEHPLFAKGSHISIEDLLTRSHRLNMVHLEEDVRFVATDTLMRKIARALKSRGGIPVHPQSDRERFRLFIVVDEAKILSMGSKDRDASTAILNVLATEYRKFGLGMVLASQMSDHFSNETKAQMATRLVLKPFNLAEAKKNAQDVNLTSDELMDLSGRGDGYLKLGDKPDAHRIQILPLSASERRN